MSHPDNFEKIIPFHFFGMILSLCFMVVVVRDIFKRTFKNPNSKAIWAISVIMFSPSVFIYLPKYAFKPRDVIQEPESNKKYIIGFVAVVVIFFGYMGYSMFSVINNFEKQPQSLNSLAASGKNQEILDLLNEGKVSQEELNGNGDWSPLHSAASNNRINTVRLLMKNGVNINQQCECNGNTPLHTAAQNGYFGIVKLLIEAGANRSIVNDKNKTAYDLAIDGGYTETAVFIEN